MKTLLLALIVFSSVSAFAKDCDDAISTVDMLNCNAENLASEDKRLNDVYKKLLAKEDKEGQKKLRAAQRAWITFRDAECEYDSDSMRGGSLQAVLYSGCLAEATKSRADVLQDQVEFR
jgi:uncharacterized protein YecT (DUF1311 family)